jgi:hypothetical protein
MVMMQQPWWAELAGNVRRNLVAAGPIPPGIHAGVILLRSEEEVSRQAYPATCRLTALSGSSLDKLARNRRRW